jgi:hypothetical protein
VFVNLIANVPCQKRKRQAERALQDNFPKESHAARVIERERLSAQGG